VKTGRNDPCPCGSTRKYKKCCASGEDGGTAIPDKLTPAELVRERGAAFCRGDFSFIYDSYHSDSPFRRTFPNRAEYLRYGASTLCDDFRIRECRILKERIAGKEAQVLFYLDTLYQGERSESFELSLFLLTDRGWRYHSSAKMDRGDFSGVIDDFDWDDFVTENGEISF
jgi:SEC-C motif-containing protein